MPVLYFSLPRRPDPMLEFTVAIMVEIQSDPVTDPVGGWMQAKSPVPVITGPEQKSVAGEHAPE